MEEDENHHWERSVHKGEEAPNECFVVEVESLTQDMVDRASLIQGKIRQISVLFSSSVYFGRDQFN